MVKEEVASVDRLRRMAAETVLEAASLTDELTDEEARPLIDWCLRQGEAAAGELLAGARPPLQSEEKAREAMMERMAPVRRMIGAINALTGRRRELGSRQVFDELDAIRSMARELPVPGGVAVTEVALAELTAWQTGFDNGDFAGALLYLLQGMPIGEAVITWWVRESGRGDGESQ